MRHAFIRCVGSFGLSSALAEARIGVFAVSTFNTDYILVRTADFDRAREALRRIGCEWRDEK